MFLKKIEPNLLKEVESLCNNNKKIDCLIYSNNYNLTKKYLSNNLIEIKEFPFISAFGLSTNKENLLKYSLINHVDYITSEAKVFTQTNIAKKIIDVDAFYNQNITGKGITVAVIDTGIAPHLDFTLKKNRIIFFKDFVNNKKKAYDDNGHGSFVSGVIAGSGVVSKNKYSGVAYNANLIGLKALNSKGETGAFTILDAMQWVYDNREKYNIKVVCMSFGSTPLNFNDPLSKGAENLWNAGVTVVAAAGNSGPSEETIKSPGINNKIITVGALEDNRNINELDINKFSIADFSSRGPAFNYFKPDCIAPGVNIVGIKNTGFYTTMSGTSVATPFVAGVCALLCEKYPKITPNQIKYILLNNCIKISGNRNFEGFGLINCKY